MPGMHGTVAAVAAMQKSDLLVALGARFDDRVTGQLSSFAPHAQIVHADIDPAEISKNRRADVPIVGDCKEVITELIDAVQAERAEHGARRPDAVVGPSSTTCVRRYPLGYDWPADGSLSPEYVIERIGQIAGPDAVYAAGVGQHQMWAAQFIKYEKPRTWLNSGGLGTMGFAVPAAMGAKMARPDAVVWCIDGDGCFQMTNQELATCAIEGIPIKVAVINNGNLGMVRQWQNLFYDERYSNTDLGTHKHRIPDFKLLAEAMGCVGLRAESKDEVDRVIQQAMEINDQPVVIDFVVGADAQVWPMVAAGTGNDEIMAARNIRPLFDGDELVPADARLRGGDTRHRHGHRRRGHGRGARRQPALRGDVMIERHTLSVLVEDKPGVLARVSGLFSRRGFNIESLAVGPTEHPDVSRMTIVVAVDDFPLEQVTKQLNKLIHVIKIVELEPAASVQRELLLVKVRADPGVRSQVLEIVDLFRAKAVDVTPEAVTIEATGTAEKIAALLQNLEPYGIREMVQSGTIAVGRGPRSITAAAVR